MCIAKLQSEPQGPRIYRDCRYRAGWVTANGRCERSPKARYFAWGGVNCPSCSRRRAAVNTEAFARGAYLPLDWITVPREEWQGAISNVRPLWIDPGEALCCEEIERAQGLIREVNQLSCEAA